jgi:hypothetical protein
VNGAEGVNPSQNYRLVKYYAFKEVFSRFVGSFSFPDLQEKDFIMNWTIFFVTYVIASFVF